MTPTAAWLCAHLSSLTGGPDPGPPPVSWAEIARAAEAESVGPALGFALSRRPDRSIPDAVGSRLTASFRHALARHVVLSRDLGILLGALREASIPAIPLKGAWLAEAVYPHPALRPMSDVDLLVRPDDRWGIDETLRGLGYRPGVDAHSWAFDLAHDAATFYDGPGGARVDVHWRLVNDPRYAWARGHADAVWDRAMPVTLAGHAALALAPEDLVLSLCMHLAVHHALAGLLWYWDLALITDRWSATLDWAALATRAEAWRVRSAVAFALAGLGERFATPDLVRDTAARLAPRGARAAALRGLLARRADRRRDLEHVIPLLVTDRARDLVGSLARAVVPAPGWVKARYGASSAARGYLAHGGRIVAVLRGASPLTGR